MRHLGVSELRKLRSLEDENGCLKRLIADLTLDKHMLAEALRIKVKAARWRTGRISAACSSTSFGQGNPWKTPSSNRSTDDSATNA